MLAFSLLPSFSFLLYLTQIKLESWDNDGGLGLFLFLFGCSGLGNCFMSRACHVTFSRWYFPLNLPTFMGAPGLSEGLLALYGPCYYLSNTKAGLAILNVWSSQNIVLHLWLLFLLLDHAPNWSEIH